MFSINDLKSELKVLWVDDQELNDDQFIEAIIKLSDQLHETEKETDEISPFIYQMF